MEIIKTKVAKLIDVKSIVTLCLTVVFCVLSIVGVVPQEFLAIYTMIIGFYFGTQATKNAEAASAKPAKAEVTGTVAEQKETEGESMVDPAMAKTIHPPDSTVVQTK